MRNIKLYIILLSFLLLFSSCAPPTISSFTEQDSFKVGDLRMLSSYDASYTYMGNQKGYYSYSSVTRRDGSFNLLYTDYESLSQVYLCNRPECAHNDETCTSWIPYTPGGAVPLLIDNTIALVYLGMYDVYNSIIPHIETLDLNGRNRKTISQLDGSIQLENRFATDGKNIYTIMQRYELKDNDIQEERSLISINIENGVMQPLYTFPQNTYEYLIGVHKQAFYTSQTIYNSLGISEETVIKRYSPQNKFSPETIFSSNSSDTSIDMQEHFLVIHDQNADSITVKNLSNNSEHTPINNLSAYIPDFAKKSSQDFFDFLIIGLQDNKLILFISYLNQDYSYEGKEWYSLDIFNGEVTPLTLLYSIDDSHERLMEILSVTPTHYLVNRQMILHQIGVDDPENGYIVVPDIYRQLALISKEDYWNSNPVFQDIQMI